MLKKVMIEGMTCMNCVKHVENALLDLEGVKSVSVNLQGKYAIMDGDVPELKIREVLEEEGYSVLEIK